MYVGLVTGSWDVTGGKDAHLQSSHCFWDSLYGKRYPLPLPPPFGIYSVQYVWHRDNIFTYTSSAQVAQQRCCQQRGQSIGMCSATMSVGRTNCCCQPPPLGMLQQSGAASKLGPTHVLQMVLTPGNVYLAHRYMQSLHTCFTNILY